MTELYESDFVDILLQLKVPTFMSTILQSIAPTRDARRTNLPFIPTLNGFSFMHDFGRTFPSLIFWHAHHLLATTQANINPNEFMRMFFLEPIITINNDDFTVNQFFGDLYLQGVNEPRRHTKWIQVLLRQLFNPIVGRRLLQRPSLADVRLHRLNVNTCADINPYTYLFGYSRSNRTNLQPTLADISRYFAETGHKLDISEFLAAVAGPTVLTHSYESVPLPTWHRLPPVPANNNNVPVHETDVTYAGRINFLVHRAAHRGALPACPEQLATVANLYLVDNQAYNPAEAPFKMQLFDEYAHVTPDVLWFSPFDINTSSLTLSLVNGFKIESGDIDGTVVPHPNVLDPLSSNDSQ